jgi:hypothetical protein
MPVDNEDFTHMIPGGLNKLLERKGEKNERRMHPMGLPSTSADWNEKDWDEWCRKHVPEWHLGKKIKHVPDWHSGKKIIHANGHHLITTASKDDYKMTSYANKDGKQLYKVPQRQMKSYETYAREDFDLALSLRRNAAAAAAAASAPTEASNWD